MQRQAPSIRHRGGTSATFSQYCRLTDGSAADMKTSEGLSLPTFPCSKLGGQRLIKINGSGQPEREAGQAGTEVNLDMPGSHSKVCSRSCLCTLLSTSTVNFLNSLSMQANQDFKKKPKETLS